MMMEHTTMSNNTHTEYMSNSTRVEWVHVFALFVADNRLLTANIYLSVPYS